jgi:aspartyl-tRNA(Asn)/glutamyl-tRNA(Gln) amidotransferase subunit A
MVTSLERWMAAEPRTISDLAVALRGRRQTAEAVTTECLARIAERNPALNAFITVLADSALAQARDADKEISTGRYRGPLHGVPISLKDLFDVEGTPTTAASKVRRDHVARADATVVARLRAAGAVLIGKTNLHEFAFGTTNEDSAFGPARHPLDATRSPGGSSGGSAASVAAGMAYASIGTDTGGSVRIPAAACGLVGLKPGFAEIETDGVVPLSTTLDHVGPLCRSVDDVALVYDVVRGHEPATPAPCPPRGLRFGVPRPYFLAQLDPQVAQAFEQACARLTDAGVLLEDVEIPHASDIAPIYLHIVLAEAAALHAGTLDSRPDDYTPNVRIRLEMGRYVLAEDYVRAMRGRDVLTQEVDAALGDREALLLPSLAIPAPRIGTTMVKFGTAEEPIRNVMLRLTQLFNITGHAAMSLPCGTTSEGLPIGAQLVGGRMSGTGALLQVAAGVERLLAPANAG